MQRNVLGKILLARPDFIKLFWIKSPYRFYFLCILNQFCPKFYALMRWKRKTKTQKLHTSTFDHFIKTNFCFRHCFSQTVHHNTYHIFGTLLRLTNEIHRSLIWIAWKLQCVNTPTLFCSGKLFCICALPSDELNRRSIVPFLRCWPGIYFVFIG